MLLCWLAQVNFPKLPRLEQFEAAFTEEPEGEDAADQLADAVRQEHTRAVATETFGDGG